MASSTLQKDKSPERPERWKRNFLKTNGMFYFAERQKPRAPRAMEPQLSEDQWHVLLCRKTGRQRATPRMMETQLSEDQWHVLLCKKNWSLERPEQWKRYFLKTSGMFYLAERQDVSVQRPERWKHDFLKINGMLDFAQALGETPTFDFRVGFPTFGRRVFS